jgi:polyhydroxyalkanoate synthase
VRDSVREKEFLELLQEQRSFYSGLGHVLDGKFYSFSSKFQVVWQDNNSRVLKFIPDKNFQTSKSQPVLFIPSLINRGYILDVMKDFSLAELLCNAGFPCYLIDWSDPVWQESHYRLEDYFTQKLSKIIEFINAAHKSGITLIGHCLGGVIAILSAILSDVVDRLVLLACPWDYSCYKDKALLFKPFSDYLLETQKLISSHVLRSFFLSFTPVEKFYKKFVEFSSLDMHDLKRELFLRVEKWSLDNMFISNGVMKEIINDFALQNILPSNEWKICNEPIDIRKIKAKSFVISGASDAVVPYISSIPLVNQLQNQHNALLPSGHVGILVGKAAKELQTKLVKWLDS